jgi:amidase
MKLNEYVLHDATALADLVRQREVTPQELAALALAAAAELNPRLNALVDRYAAEAEAEIARGLPAGPFTGVPFLVKDMGAFYAGKPTAMGSRLFARAVAPVDSELVTRYRRAGLVTVGRTNVPELALSFVSESVLHGPARNPWDPTRSPGGSSGGAAAAVAARIVPMAHGNDAAGSVRVPASCCGLFGLKPTRARTPAGPLVGEIVFGLGVEHALTRSVRDSAALLDATAGADPGAPYDATCAARPFLAEVTTPPGRLRIAYVDETPSGVPVVDACREGARRAASLCESLGHTVIPARFPTDWASFRAALYPLVCAFVANLTDAVCPRLGLVPGADNLEPSNLALAARGRSLGAVQLADALAGRDRLSRVVGRFFEGFDVLLTPTQAALPPPIGALRLDGDADEVLDRLFAFAPFTALFNLTGGPAMSVPLHADRGLPIGVQFGARVGDEATLFRLAGQLEQAAPWADRRPPVVAG